MDPYLDRQSLDAVPDPEKLCRPDRIRIRNTDYKVGYQSNNLVFGHKDSENRQNLV